jgi:uncharacterized protein
VSEREVAVVRQAFEAFGRGDHRAMMALLAPDAEWHPYTGQLGADRVHRGPEEIERAMRDLDEHLSLSATAEEFVDLGTQVMVPLRAHGTGRGSGIDVGMSWVQLWTVRNEQIIRVESFSNRESALVAAGADRG